MKRTIRRTLRQAVLASMFVLAWLAPAMAWAETVAPAPSLKKAPPAWLGMLIMFVLMGMVLAVSLLPSKRGHQD